MLARVTNRLISSRQRYIYIYISFKENHLYPKPPFTADMIVLMDMSSRVATTCYVTIKMWSDPSIH